MERSAEKSRILYFYALAVALFAILAFSGYFFAEKWTELSAPAPAAYLLHGPSLDTAYVTLPRVTVNIGNNAASHVRMDISLEVDNKDISVVEGYVPKIVDKLNMYFPKFRFDELDRPHAMFLLHKDMLYQINSVGMPIVVHDVLLKNLVVM